MALSFVIPVQREKAGHIEQCVMTVIDETFRSVAAVGGASGSENGILCGSRGFLKAAFTSGFHRNDDGRSVRSAGFGNEAGNKSFRISGMRVDPHEPLATRPEMPSRKIDTRALDAQGIRHEQDIR
jgi:hypothetical protein